MSKRAEELWSENWDYESDGTPCMSYARFIAALHEYGTEVRRRDAEVCGEQKPGATGGVLTATYYELGVKHCAAAITKEPMP